MTSTPEEIARFRRAFRNLADRSDADVERMMQEYEAEATKANPQHYTFFQPNGTCFSITATDAYEAKEKELRFLGLPRNASFMRYAEDMDTPAKMRAALRKSHRMYKDANACPMCGSELEYAGEFDGSTGVTGGHVGFGDTYQCENGHWFAWIQGVLVPASRVLTVVEGS